MFLYLGANHFPFKFPFEKKTKSSFFRFGAEIRFEAAISGAIARKSFCVCVKACCV